MNCQRKTRVIKLNTLQSQNNGNQSLIVKECKAVLIKVSLNNLDTLLKYTLDSRISSDWVIKIMRSGTSSIWPISTPNTQSHLTTMSGKNDIEPIGWINI